MQRIPKKNTITNKWEGYRRIQTEANDQDDQFDINALMKKYKNNFQNDYNQYQLQQNVVGKKPQKTNGSGSNFNSNINGHAATRKSNGQSIENATKIRKSYNGSSLNNNKNILNRNYNYNRSLIQNSNNNNINHHGSSNGNYGTGNNFGSFAQGDAPSNNNTYSSNNAYKKAQDFGYKNKQNILNQNSNNQNDNTQHKTGSFINNTNYNNNQNNFQQQNQSLSQQKQSQQQQSQQVGHQQQLKQQQQYLIKQQKNPQIPPQFQQQQQQSQQDVSSRVQTEPVQSQPTDIDPSKFTYSNEKVVGSGTFGVVYKSKIKETGQIVAIKKVLQDKRYKNRELQILQELNHPNVLKMIHAYFTTDQQTDETYLHVVMQYIPETVYSLNRLYIKQRQYMPQILVKLYAYQIMRSLVYIHTQGICHRDIKPHNILVDPQSNRVVLCDFGSAKKLIKGEPNISYICSRCYRAPELIFGAVEYDNQIDMWSSGCVIAEMINGEPLFIGDSAVNQLIEIIKVLGTPSKQQVLEMNDQYDLNDYKFPEIKSKDWKKVLRPKTDPLCIDFVSKVLVYSPIQRLTPIQAIAHPYFDELRDEKKLKMLSAKMRIPNLFDFTQSELNMDPSLMHKIIPSWYFEKYGIKNHH